jgi:hypothetical protein
MKKLGLIVILTFFVRLIALFVLRSFKGLDFLSFDEYNVIALNILSGKGFVYDYLNSKAYFFGPSPLYVYYLVLLHTLTNSSYLVMKIIQIVISTVAVVPLFFIANKIFNKNTAVISALLYCFHPVLVVFSVQDTSLLTLFILTLVFFIVCFKSNKIKLFVLGMLIGAGILLRATFISFIPAYFIYLVRKKERLSVLCVKFSIILLLALVVIFPWISRGYKIYNRFIFISTTSAEHFWRGNNPLAIGTGRAINGQDVLSLYGGDFRDKVLSLNEIDKYDFFRQEALKFIKSQPVSFLKLAVKKFFYFWSFSPQTGILYPKPWLIAYGMFYIFIYSFFAVGSYFVWNNKNAIGISFIEFLICFFIIISLIQSFYYVDSRHRIMLEPLVMILSAYGIERAFAAFPKRILK